MSEVIKLFFPLGFVMSLAYLSLHVQTFDKLTCHTILEHYLLKYILVINHYVLQDP